MNAGKITAKIRDAVPVCIIVEGKEIGRYDNVHLPEELKAAEIYDFRFDISAEGKISFHLMYEAGVLPETLPPERVRATRAELAAAKAAKLAAEVEKAEAKAKEWMEKQEAKQAALSTVAPVEDADEPTTTETPGDAPTVAEGPAQVETPASPETPGDAPATPVTEAEAAPIETTAKRKGRPAKAAAN